ncbi:hypothetical protein Tco_0934030 [Tanacetum coccineum]
MSQNPNEQGHFTNLFNLNPSYQQETGSNPSTPSSQNSQSSLAFQQYPGFGTQYGAPIPPPEQIYRQQQQQFINHQLNNQFQNFQQQKNAPFQNLQKQPDAFQQSQPQPRRGKRVAKRATVDLVDENEEEEEPIRQCARWTREEEILLTQCWIETSENGQIGADRSEDSFWGQIMDDFNTSSTQGYRTRHMLTGKWTRTNADCQKFNAIYKHLERKSGENEADHIEAAKITFAAQQPKGRKFQLEHCWRILRGHPKWDAPTPLDTEDHTEIFGADVRPRPAGKTRPAKKTKSETTGSSGGSASGSISDYVSEDLRRKLQAGTSAYEAKKAKEMAMIEFKEMEFLTIDADSLPEPKASIIRSRQEKIIAKYTQQ